MFAAFVVIGRDQVSLIATYVLVGYVLWHWLDGTGRRKRLAASLKPLAAGAIVGACIVTVPVMLTELLALCSNRPDISFALAVHGSLHPASLLMLAFADVFGASDFGREFWGPPGIPWHEMIGQTGLYVSQNTGQIYTGALVAVALVGLGVVRGALWTREIRFFTVAAALTLLYALGKYTPLLLCALRTVPGVALYRRPADATFVLCALLAIVAGYLMHRFLTGTLPPLPRWQRAAEIAICRGACRHRRRPRVTGRHVAKRRASDPLGDGIFAAAIAVLVLARRLANAQRDPAAACWLFSPLPISAGTTRRTSRPGCQPRNTRRLRPDTTDETITLLKSKLKAAAAPDRRDRVELIGVAYHSAEHRPQFTTSTICSGTIRCG